MPLLDKLTMQDEGLEALQRHLESAQSRVRRKHGRMPGESEQTAIKEALDSLFMLRSSYHEALAEIGHSVLPKQIQEDFASLTSLLRTFGDNPLSPEQDDLVRRRIRSWHYESRRWIHDLPHQPCLLNHPTQGADFAERARNIWLKAGGAWFAPPPHSWTPPVAGVPERFRFLMLNRPWLNELEPMNTKPVGAGEARRRHWECLPTPLIQLLEIATEALELELEGPNQGGHSPFAQRRRKTSLKDAFTLSCLRIYEAAVGAKSARQSQYYGISSASSFESFVAMTHTWIVGVHAPDEWKPGRDPIRKAIRIQRAWQKLLTVAGCMDEDEFNAMPPEMQMAAAQKLPEEAQKRLRTSAPPLV